MSVAPRQSWTSANVTLPSSMCRAVFTLTGTYRRSACGNGIGRRSTASTAAKIAEFAPMPIASASVAAAAKAGR
jgi:hypothetical protein